MIFQNKACENDRIVILSEKCLALLHINRSAQRRRGRKRINIKKVGPFCILKIFLSFFVEWSNVSGQSTSTWNIAKLIMFLTFLTFLSSKINNVYKNIAIIVLIVGFTLRKLSTYCVQYECICCGDTYSNPTSQKRSNRHNSPQDERKKRVQKEWTQNNITTKLGLLRSQDISDKDHITLNSEDSIALKVVISTSFMISIIIKMLLACQNVETNPGPMDNKNYKSPKSNLSIITYNCNGLANDHKKKRVLSKCSNLIKQNCIIMLQETHLPNDSSINTLWKSNFSGSFYRSNSAGVLTLYGNDFETILEARDKIGRQSFVVIKNALVKLLIVNVYVPNDHRQAIGFIEEVYLKIHEILNLHADCQLILGGDFNTCMRSTDGLNRAWNKDEEILANNIIQNNKTCQIVDSYRWLNKEDGFSWNRGNCYSRLDYLFSPISLSRFIIKASTDWGFDKSDHAAVKIDWHVPDEPVRGPGIMKVNSQMLNDPAVVKKIDQELKGMLRQIPDNWDDHQRLEFLKMSIRSVMCHQSNIHKNEIREKIAELEEGLNNMEQLKIKATKERDLPAEESGRRLALIDEAILSIKADLLRSRTKLDKDVEFRSKANWYENGEKPTKYFLNLNKHFQKQKLIGSINDDNKTYVGNDQVIGGIKNFYENLYKQDILHTKPDETFFNHCPKLNQDDADETDKEITKDELFNALKSCKDSSPGPDGIPYVVYRKLWHIAGDFIHKSWIHSVKTNRLPSSHIESVITLLPKEGKDHSEIKNWRPITLSNCDAKIITKALAIRMSKILDKIIDPSQTAYIPGRSVMDNIRSNMYTKKYCKDKKIDAILVSLDAKKAFDSVSHEYIEKVLEKYGFGQNFRQAFKILYKDITARILVNGFFSDKISIERGVKQGDALSCAIFILCMDPLIRNLNKNEKIVGITLDLKGKATPFQHKSSGYADDISIICRDTKAGLDAIFSEYQRLTEKSGLELNADKTEILRLTNVEKKTYAFEYRGDKHAISNVEKIKICGIYFSADSEVERQHNVDDKISKLECKLRPWIKRGLSLEGKILLVKTFGMSQLIYNMQCIEFSDSKIKEIEMKIFSFIWSKKSSDGNSKSIDRIKRSVLKNEYSEGGLKATDVDCMNRALKLRQYIRSNKTNHVINKIQHKCILDSNNYAALQQDFGKITKNEVIVENAQTTLQMIIDHNRQMTLEKYEDSMLSKETINQISSINVAQYLRRKCKVFALCIYKSDFSEHETLVELVQEAETVLDRKKSRMLEMILSNFPKELRQLALSFDDNVNEVRNEIEKIELSHDNWVSIENLTTKIIQSSLKIALGKISSTDVKTKIGLSSFDNNNFIKVRQQCKNTKMRAIYHRLTNNDFFSYERMCKFKMTNDNSCPRCGMLETTKHMLWECHDSKIIWNNLNKIVSKLGLNNEQIIEYEDIYNVTDNSPVTHIKLKIIQEMIQITRPTGWNEHRLTNIINSIIITEKYLAIKNGKLVSWQKNWSNFTKIIVSPTNPVTFNTI